MASRKKRGKRISTSMISNLLMNESQRKKFVLVEDEIDYKGIIHLNRVENQTIFDVMFVRGFIKQPQHEAVFCFIDVLSKSGAYPSGVNLDEVSHMPAHAVGDQIALRRLAFSAPYRSMVEKCEEREVGYLMAVMDNVFCFPRKGPEEYDFARRLSRLIQNPLWALATHYRVVSKRDPRDIIAMQFAGRLGGQ